MLHWTEIFAEKHFEENKNMTTCTIAFEGNLKDETKHT